MPEPDFRREPIRSRQYLNGARDQRCTFQIPDVCEHGTESTVACHLHDETFGKGRKADDTSTADGCRACHDVMDGRGSVHLSREEWLFYALRGLQRTIRRRVFQNLLTIHRDAPKPVSAHPVPKRKPKEQRAEINGRRDIPSRPMRSKHKPNTRDIHEDVE